VTPLVEKRYLITVV